MGIVSGLFLVIAVIAAIVFTVLAYIYVMPEDKEKSENVWIKRAHELCNFKRLYIEDIMRCLYIFTTIVCICCGAANLLTGIISIFAAPYACIGYLLSAIGLVVLGPVFTRISYEFIMLTILLVKNVIEINKKMK